MYTYAYYDDQGFPLYVGLATDVLERFEQHMSNDPWASEIASISVWSNYKNKTEAAIAEKNLIGSLHPKYNMTFSSYRPDTSFDQKPDLYFASPEKFCNYYSHKPDTIVRRTHYFTKLDLEALRVIIYHLNTDSSLLMRRYLKEGIERDQDRIGHPGIYAEAQQNLIKQEKRA